MKNILLLFSLLLVNQNNFSQNIPLFPFAISFGQAEVWGDSIYYFGGSNNYSGTELYHRVYKYNNLFPVVVKAIQDLKTEKDKEIASLKTENQKLREELEALKEVKLRLAKLEQLINSAEVKFSSNISE
ncbi:hypothetical protein [Ignavibacterium sp.]|uniref:hypothetical protein n=1 Tax=Ignavibacterium sp. TaxID=2651167 RepID=UPI00307EEE7A